MKNLMNFLALCLSLALAAGCASATPMPTATIPATPNPPTATNTATPNPPTATPPPTPTMTAPTEVPATATVAVPELKPDWAYAAGGPILSPVTVADGVIYFGSEDGCLYAVNIATHDLKWKFTTGGSVRSQPAVTKKMVYAASDDSYLYAVSRSDGSMLWKQKIEKEALQRDPTPNTTMDWFTSSPVVQDTSLYIGSTDGSLYALDTETGKTLWKYSPTTYIPIRNTPQVGDGMVYFGNSLGNYYALDAKSGTEVWYYSSSDTNISNGMTLIDHVLYFMSSGGFHALDAKSGQEKWNVPMNVVSGFIPAYDNGILYADGNGYPMGAYEAATGKVLWKSATLINYLIITSPVVGQYSVYFGNDGDALYALDKKTGAIKWKFRIVGVNGKSGVDANAAVANGMVYFGGMDGKLYAFKDQ